MILLEAMAKGFRLYGKNVEIAPKGWMAPKEKIYYSTRNDTWKGVNVGYSFNKRWILPTATEIIIDGEHH